MTDAERLRTALINILGNARHAVEASAAARDPAPTAVRTSSSRPAAPASAP